MGSWYRFYKKYFMERCAAFSGRIKRQEYICRQTLLLLSVLCPGLILFFAVLPGKGAMMEEFLTLWSFYFAWCCIILLVFAYITVSISLMIRRLHDLDRSGWLLLTLLVPVVNALVLLWLSCAKGTSGNQYGAATTVANKDVFWDAAENCRRPLQKIYGYLKGDFLKDYFTLSGRLTCREYFFLFMAPSVIWGIIKLSGQLLYLMLLWLPGISALTVYLAQAGNIINLVMNLLILLLLFTVDVRRSHDHGTGWYYSLLALIPFVNFIYIVRQFCLTGEERDNKYGQMRTYTDATGALYNDDY